MMGDSDENNPNLIRSTDAQEGPTIVIAKVVDRINHGRRRALKTIDQNVLGVQPKKRGLSEKRVPQSLIKRQLHLERIMKSISSSSSLNGSEKENQGSDDPVSTFANEMEPMEEADQMEEEIEMQDMMAELVLDIDSNDSNNPLAVVDYVEDIYSYYRKVESLSCVSPNYMMQQSDINEKMRAILIDWLVEVHYAFKLMDETLFLMVNLVDRFLAQKITTRKELQLIGLTALLLACKYGDARVPFVGDLILISSNMYTREQVIDTELSMINTLQFNLFAPTAYVFTRRFVKAARHDKKLELLSFFFVELCLLEYQMLKFLPSLLAASAVYTAQCTLDRVKNWSKTSEWHSGYLEDQLLQCSKLMVTFHQNAVSGKLTAIYRKYSMVEFEKVAKLEPAQFLLET